MRLIPMLLVAFALASEASVAGEKSSKPLLEGLVAPRSVAVRNDGRVFVCEQDKESNENGGRILAIDNGKAIAFAKNLDTSGPMVAWMSWLFVAQGDKILRIDQQGKATVFVAPGAF